MEANRDPKMGKRRSPDGPGVARSGKLRRMMELLLPLHTVPTPQQQETAAAAEMSSEFQHSVLPPSPVHSPTASQQFVVPMDISSDYIAGDQTISEPNNSANNDSASDSVPPSAFNDILNDPELFVDDEPDQPYTVTKREGRRFLVDAAREVTYDVHFDDQFIGVRMDEMYGQLENMFTNVLDEATEDLDKNDGVFIRIDNQGIDPIIVPYTEKKNLQLQDIFEAIENVLQSHRALKIEDDFSIMIGTVKQVRGAGRKQYFDLRTALADKGSVIQIKNDDVLCMARSIAMAWVFAIKIPTVDFNEESKHVEGLDRIGKVFEVGKAPQSLYDNMKGSSRKEQENVARELCIRAGVSTAVPSTLGDVKAFEKVIQKGIGVLSARLGNKFIHVPSMTEDGEKVYEKSIFIYYTEFEGSTVGHYDALNSVTGLLSASYFCTSCKKTYSNKYKHRCQAICIACKCVNCATSYLPLTCVDCNVKCKSEECFKAHKEKRGKSKYSPCETYWHCVECKKIIFRRKQDPTTHRCGEWTCPKCKLMFVGEHLCYQRALKPKDTSNFKHIYYDFECRQDETENCDDGFVNNPHKRCRKCEEKTHQCHTCALCQNCGKSWCGVLVHKPNLVVAQTACHVCEDEDMDYLCNSCGTRCDTCGKCNNKGVFTQDICQNGVCGQREVKFSGDSTLEDFGKWLFCEQKKNFTVIAHNAKGYDNYFLLNYMINQSIPVKKVIYNGSKIMYLVPGNALNIRFLDSFNFLGMKLAALAPTFDLEESKGYFPHFFNTKDHQDCDQDGLPPASDYGVAQMSTKDKQNFEKWYDENQHVHFNFQEEILKYCRADVDILRKACLKFRRSMIEMTTGENNTGVDPFHYITIASVCQAIFRTKFLPEMHKVSLKHLVSGDERQIHGTYMDNAWTYELDGHELTANDLKDAEWEVNDTQFVSSPLAYVPVTGYRDNYSKKSILWLKWIEKTRGVKIRHALSPQGEYRVPGMSKVDGYDAENRKVFQFHGCIWHACPKCYEDGRESLKHPYTGEPFNRVFRRTEKQDEDFHRRGYDPEVKWECEFDADVKNDPELQKFIEKEDIVDRLDPREAFAGGRTEAVKIYHKMTGDEKGGYLDVNSLYPSVNKWSAYMVGHPVILYGSAITKTVDKYYGLAKVKILPPRGLYLPVLPYLSHGKLKFVLCSTCAAQQSNTPCQCSDDKRMLLGTWTTLELAKAMELGYKVVKVYEVHHFEEKTVYDPARGKGGILAGFMNLFMKVKWESSGWPADCGTDESKDRFVADFKRVEGITLDPENIKKNPGARSIAKICLNSLWGKMGEKTNRTQTELINEAQPEKFYSLISDPKKKIHQFRIISKDTIAIDWTYHHEMVPQECTANSNIYIACLTTSLARLKLYEAAEMLGERCVYMDTDSVLFIDKPGLPKPDVSAFLGGWSSELEPDEYIILVVASGPKAYGYVTNKGKKVVKVRGFTLNHENAKHLHMETLVQEVMGNPQNVVLVNNHKITRDKYRMALHTKREQKKYSMVFDKRVIGDNYLTYPYGY